MPNFHPATRHDYVIEEESMLPHPHATSDSSTSRKQLQFSRKAGVIEIVHKVLRTIVGWILEVVFRYNAKKEIEIYLILFLVLLAMLLSLFLSCSLVLFPRASSAEQVVPPSAVKKPRGVFFPPDIQNNWAPYTPYFPAQAYQPPPDHCSITQVGLSLSSPCDIYERNTAG